MRRCLTAAAAVATLLLCATAPADASLTARGSIKQAYVLGAKKGQRLVLINAEGRVVATGRADRFGSKIFRELKPGGGYRVRAGKRSASRFKVLRPGANPPRSFYKRQKLKQGLNYVKMRDGVELAMTVRLPAGKTLERRPVPDLHRVLGLPDRGAERPARLGGRAAAGGGAPADPLAPASSTAVGSLIGPLLGFAVVSVQMRGSGCSGGAFDLFDLPTTYDGYDAVETVAAQSWVKGGKVGMGGISFSGITQLFVAGTQPPHLAAIAPMSVTDDLYTATGYPGGIFNSGFAQDLGAGAHGRREAGARRRPAVGAGAESSRATSTASPTRSCACRPQDALEIQKQNPFRTPSLFDHRAPGPVAQATRRCPCSSSASSRTSRPAGTSPRASST